MYFVKYGKEYLHDPRENGRVLLELSLDCEENSCGYCDFTIYPNHPMFDKLKERDAQNPIEVYDGDILLFAGFIYERAREFYMYDHIRCKGELDYFRESVVRPYTTLPSEYHEYALEPTMPKNLAPSTVDGYFEWLVEQHNAQVPYVKQFTIGKNQGAIMDQNNYIFRENTQYPTTIDEISEKLLHNDYIGGYLVTRHENNTRYIDYIKEWTEANTQVLNFGVNLTDYTQTDDSVDLCTFVIPLGARMSETGYSYNNGYFLTSDKMVDLDKDYYTSTEAYRDCTIDDFVNDNGTLRFANGVAYYEHDEIMSSVAENTPIDPNRQYYMLYTNQTGTQIVVGGETYVEITTEEASATKATDGLYFVYYSTYFVKNDTDPVDGKVYYVERSNGTYSQCNKDMMYFEPGVDYYEYDENLDESNLSLTIDGMANGEYGSSGYVKNKDIIYCEKATDKYGLIGTVYENSEITTKEELIWAGIEFLKQLVSPKRNIEIKAIDMHLANPNIKPIRIGEYVRVRSVPHGLDSYFLCRSIDLDLNNPENSLYTLGSTFDKASGQSDDKINELNRTISNTVEQV